MALTVWPLAAAATFAALGWSYLANLHPSEDAYILFVYVRSLVELGTIAYYPGGPPTEGATDFLWFMALSALNAAGLLPGMAAIVLNALGAAIVTGLLLLASRELPLSARHVLGFMATLAMAFAPPSISSYEGFSTLLYASMIGATFYVLWRGPERRLWIVPILGLVVALYRPDGVVVGLTACAVALAICLREGSGLRYLLISGAVCAFVGCAYFAWRWSYFGLTWPLPLYVKWDPRLIENVRGLSHWARDLIWAAPLCVAALVLDTRRSRLLLAVLPAVTLLIALLFIAQTQNIHYRFQNATFAVIAILAVQGLTLLLSGRARRMPPWASAAVIGAVGVAATSVFVERAPTVQPWEERTPRLADTVFPRLASKVSPDIVSAISEAGRFAYWMPGRKVDTVGLNTPEIAVDGLLPGTLERLDPDLIYVSNSGSYRRGQCGGNRAVRTTPAELRARRYYPDGAWHAISDPVLRSSVAGLERLSVDDRYVTFLFCMWNAYHFALGVRRDGKVPIDVVADVLEESATPANRIGYLDAEATFESAMERAATVGIRR